MEVGGLTYCPDDVLPALLEWLVLCYIGEPSFGQWSSHRPVFYSNTGAPLAMDIIKSSERDISSAAEALAETSKQIKQMCGDQHVARRFQQVLDSIQK